MTLIFILETNNLLYDHRIISSCSGGRKTTRELELGMCSQHPSTDVVSVLLVTEGLVD